MILVLVCVLSSCGQSSGQVVDNESKETTTVNEVVESQDKSMDMNRSEDVPSDTEDEELDDSIKELINRANEGDDDAQNKLSYYYFNGYKVKKDYKKSLMWSIKSANNGNLASMFNVGYHYYNGYAGKVDYDLAFEWYKRAADKMFPKALNALGSMYYRGEGVEKDITLAYEYTLQSAGLLHTYSLSNMGVMIDELELDQDSSIWYRLAAKNYTMPSSSNSILYDKLLAGENIMGIDYKIDLDSIPTNLIKDILYRYYSGTLNDYLEEESSAYKNFDLKELNMNEDDRSMLEYSWWYNTNYLVDIDSDGTKELIAYQLDGTIGISSFKIFKSVDGKYIEDESLRNTDLAHGINGIIDYNDLKYFVVGNISIDNRSIPSVSIYPIKDSMLADSVKIETVEEGMMLIKTYQVGNEYDDLVKQVENRINNMFVLKYGSLLYENLNESMVLDIDIDNDNSIEHYEYDAIFYGTINRPIGLEVKEGLTSEEDLETINMVLGFSDITIPIGIETFTQKDANYVSVLSYGLGTNNHCLTTFLLEENKRTIISNHLITFSERFIVTEDNE
jgi:TPR repeat protein